MASIGSKPAPGAAEASHLCASAVKHQDITRVVNLAVSAVSLVATVFVIAMYIGFARLATSRVDRLVFHLTVCGAVGACALLAKGSLEATNSLSWSRCVASGAAIEFAYLAQVIYTFLLSLNLYVQVRASLSPDDVAPALTASQRRPRTGKQPVCALVEAAYVLYGYLAPALYVGALVWLVPYHHSGFGWCDPENRLFTAVPLLAHYAATIVLLGLVLHSLRRGIRSAGMFAEKGRRVELQALRRFSLFLVPVLVAVLPIVVLSILSSSHDCAPLWLVIFANVAFPLQGFLNALIFGVNKDLRRDIAACCSAAPRSGAVDVYPALLPIDAPRP